METPDNLLETSVSVSEPTDAELALVIAIREELGSANSEEKMHANIMFDCELKDL